MGPWSLLLGLLPLVAVAFQGPGEVVRRTGPVPASQGPISGPGPELPTTYSGDAGTALPPRAQEPGRGVSSCKARKKSYLPSALGGFAIGLLMALPAAAITVSQLYPAAVGHAAEQIESIGRPSKVGRASSWHSELEPDAATLESLQLFWPRCMSLVATLLIQSISSIILGRFNMLIERHPALILFLTTIVGLGGNAGCQSTVLSVRRLALGQNVSILEQFRVGVLLSLIVAPLMLVRTLLQGAVLRTSLTIVFSCAAITIVATTLGCSLPKLLWRMDIDPAHSASFIQVAMDILGILIVCVFGVLFLS